MRISFFRPASALNSKPEKPLDLIYSFLPLFFYQVTYIPSSLLLSSDPEIVQNKQMGSSQNIFCLEKPSPSGGEGEREGKRGLDHKKGNARDKYWRLEGQYFVALPLMKYNMAPNITIQLCFTHSGWKKHLAIPLRHYPPHYPASYSWTESPCHIKCPCSIQCTYTMSIIGFPSPMLDTHSPFSLSCPSPPCCLSKWN